MRSEGQGGLLRAVSLLEGWEAPAAAWEQVLLPAALRGNVAELLERACWTGDVAWGRLSLREPRPSGPRGGARWSRRLRARSSRDGPQT
jgi:ATP-dependent Lhr-like helicase